MKEYKRIRELEKEELAELIGLCDEIQEAINNHPGLFRLKEYAELEQFIENVDQEAWEQLENHAKAESP